MSSVVLPSLDKNQIKRLARELAPAFILYHPGRKWFRAQYCGNTYFFPPDLGGKFVDHPQLRNADGAPMQVPANGVLHIKDRYGKLRGTKAVPIYHPEYGYAMGYGLPVIDNDGKIEDESADKVVNFFINKYGSGAETAQESIGLTLLTGDPTTDDGIKAASQGLFVKSQLAWAESERDNRMKQIAEWRQKNPGRTDIPPMNVRQREAEEILLSAEETKNIETLEFVCQCGGYETDNEALFNKHIRLRHPNQVQEFVETSPSAAEIVPAPVKRGRGRPRKSPLPVDVVS